MGRIEKDNFLVVGISHKTAPIEIREKFTFNDDEISTVLTRVYELSGIRECVILSTCNRTEIYALADKAPEEVRKRIGQFILEFTGERDDFLTYLYYLNGTDMIEHLFHVTCGLDSMILGETQIFGQVKNAYASACDSKFTGTAINRLFHHAFQVGKNIRNATSIGEGAVSVSSAAVNLAKEIFGSLKKHSILLVGAGKIGKLCVKQLVDCGIEGLYITNRTSERASALAEELSGEVIPYDTMEDMYKTVDIIITSVASCMPILTKTGLIPHIEHRTGKPLFLIDLGVPRNIDPDVAGIESVHLYNIDNLEDVTLENQDKRKNEAEKAKEIIKKEVLEYCNWLKEREVIPVIRDLRKKCESIRQEELERIKNTVSSKTFQTVDLATRRIVRKILHDPTVALRSSKSGETRKRLLESIHDLFIKENKT